MKMVFNNGKRFIDFFQTKEEYNKAYRLYKKGFREDDIVNEVLKFRENRLMYDGLFLDWYCFKNGYNLKRITSLMNRGLSLNSAVEVEKEFYINEKKIEYLTRELFILRKGKKYDIKRA